uniref:Uncharacterized protein n=1 Tax=Ackermannviridae sp. TaxID=2831612 RepID=A0A8S5VLC8_9CAUD|nr:MAG TPA: hypothetical protein [Ackermannviridae sp.]
MDALPGHDLTRKADGIRRRWCKSSRPDGRALMG